jgi:guanylate kinase
MIIVLVGASGSGKSALEKEISSHYGYNKVISYTTRPKRENEVNGRDYHFISEKSSQVILEQGLFAEYDEYSQNRKYGSLISDYKNGNGVAVLTPNGLRQVKERCKDSIFSVYVDSNLGT